MVDADLGWQAKPHAGPGLGALSADRVAQHVSRDPEKPRTGRAAGEIPERAPRDPGLSEDLGGEVRGDVPGMRRAPPEDVHGVAVIQQAERLVVGPRRVDQLRIGRMRRELRWWGHRPYIAGSGELVSPRNDIRRAAVRFVVGSASARPVARPECARWPHARMSVAPMSCASVPRGCCSMSPRCPADGSDLRRSGSSTGSSQPGRRGGRSSRWVRRTAFARPTRPGLRSPRGRGSSPIPPRRSASTRSRRSSLVTHRGSATGPPTPGPARSPTRCGSIGSGGSCAATPTSAG